MSVNTLKGVRSQRHSSNKGSSKASMLANAKDELGTVGSADGPSRDGDVPNFWMPHRELEADELDAMFPPLVAPEEENLHDVDNDQDDPVLIHGFKLAKQIEHDMIRYGRTRKLPKNGSQVNNSDTSGDMIGHINHDHDNHSDDHNNHVTATTTTTTTTTSNTPGHSDASSVVHVDDNHRPTFLYDNNSCSSLSFVSQSSEDVGIRGVYESRGLEESPSNASNLAIKCEVHAPHSLCLRGSVKSLSTDYTIMAMGIETLNHLNMHSQKTETVQETDMHVGIVWLKSQAQRSRCEPFAHPAC